MHNLAGARVVRGSVSVSEVMQSSVDACRIFTRHGLSEVAVPLSQAFGSRCVPGTGRELAGPLLELGDKRPRIGNGRQ